MNAIPPALSNSPIVAAFAARTPGSAAAYAKAREIFPGGVTHDTRYVRPHPLSITRAAGGRKWDVDGNEYVDYFGGHGALILGHAHPEVVARIAEQAAKVPPEMPRAGRGRIRRCPEEEEEGSWRRAGGRAGSWRTFRLRRCRQAAQP